MTGYVSSTVILKGFQVWASQVAVWASQVAQSDHRFLLLASYLAGQIVQNRLRRQGESHVRSPLVAGEGLIGTVWVVGSKLAR